MLDSEISGLPDRHAFLKLGNYVAHFSFAYYDIPTTQHAFVPRPLEDDDLGFDPKTLAKKPAEPETTEEDAESHPERILVGRLTMLKISKALSAGKLENYHRQEFTSPNQSIGARARQCRASGTGDLPENMSHRGRGSRRISSALGGSAPPHRRAACPAPPVLRVSECRWENGQIG